MYDEITFPFPNSNDATVEVSEWISNSHYIGWNYLSMLGLKLFHISIRAPATHLSWLSIKLVVNVGESGSGVICGELAWKDRLHYESSIIHYKHNWHHLKHHGLWYLKKYFMHTWVDDRHLYHLNILKVFLLCHYWYENNYLRWLADHLLIVDRLKRPN